MRLPDDCQYLVQPGPFYGQEAEPKLIFQWFSQQPEVLASLPLLPSFLQTGLQELPEVVRHVVHYDE
jgi:hypothetical protein